MILSFNRTLVSVITVRRYCKIYIRFTILTDSQGYGLTVMMKLLIEILYEEEHDLAYVLSQKIMVKLAVIFNSVGNSRLYVICIQKLRNS